MLTPRMVQGEEKIRKENLHLSWRLLKAFYRRILIVFLGIKFLFDFICTYSCSILIQYVSKYINYVLVTKTYGTSVFKIFEISIFDDLIFSRKYISQNYKKWYRYKFIKKFFKTTNIQFYVWFGEILLKALKVRHWLFWFENRICWIMCLKSFFS